jgi:Sigma-70, region 4
VDAAADMGHGRVRAPTSPVLDPARLADHLDRLYRLPYREAARTLGIREATLTSRLCRARARIVKALDPPIRHELRGRTK